MDYLVLISNVIYMINQVLQVWGYGCPRYPVSACHGPFTIRPSIAERSHADLSSCDADQTLMDSCLKQCMDDLCCRAFGVENGKCILANFQTEAYNFVKEAPVWPVSPDVCLTETAGCRRAIVGSDGGIPFSFNQTFISAASDLKAIGGAFDTESFLVQIKADYGNGFIVKQNAARDVVSHSSSFYCELDVGEYITSVKTFMQLTWGVLDLPKGIQFTTTKKTCGPYGLITSKAESLSGHMLLYVAGCAGYGFDKLEYVFLSC